MGVRGELRRTSSPEVVLPVDPDVTKPASKTFAIPPTVDTAVPPPSNMNGSVIFSSVFTEKHEWSWSIRFLLAVHEPIRHALFVTDRFLEQSHRQEQVETLERLTQEFFRWFKSHFIEYLKCQHEIKVKVLHPVIKISVSTTAEIMRSYEGIYGTMDEILQQEASLLRKNRRLDRSAWLLRLDSLQKAIRRLNFMLHSVLNLEETSLHPAMSAAFDERTFQTHVLPRLFRGIKAKKVIVPWIVERSKVWGGEEEQKSFKGMLPFSARFMYKKIWRPYFMSNVAVAMKNLNEFELAMQDNPYTSRREDFFGCTVQ
ncbi:hypothetical protein P43SY_001624 [Pythium insidiosum]|uniref:Uncharacterized protein n=1 Tax=Pythium insidiosum TaxID=114742 RepID=A0AAD5LN77_PYTIN|nr:hypothetical protein P43SY_001624 [Pythium insidiosum]